MHTSIGIERNPLKWRQYSYNAAMPTSATQCDNGTVTSTGLDTGIEILE